MITIQHLLGKNRPGLAVSEIAWGRADQFGYFVRMLKLGAIDLDHRIRIAEQNFGGGLDRTRFTRASRSQEEQCAKRLVRQSHLCEIDLVNLRERKHRVVLSDNAFEQFTLEFARLIAPLSGVERDPTTSRRLRRRIANASRGPRRSQFHRGHFGSYFPTSVMPVFKYTYAKSSTIRARAAPVDLYNLG